MDTFRALGLRNLAGLAIACTAALTVGGVAALAAGPAGLQDPGSCLDEAGDAAACDSDDVERVAVPAAPEQPEERLASAPSRQVFTPHSGADSFRARTCDAYITSGYVYNFELTAEFDSVQGTLVTTHTGVASSLEVDIWPQGGGSIVEWVVVGHLPSTTAYIDASPLTPGVTYDVKVVAIDAYGVACPPRYGSFTAQTMP